MAGTRPSPLHLGVMCAVIEEGRLLLSQRGDLHVWALPGGRLDLGERLSDAAARETHEETGLRAQIVQPAGLYYLAGWGRMNVLYLAKPRGGKLQKTDETRDNRFFRVGMLPEMPLAEIAADAARYVKDTPRPALRVIETPPREMRRMRFRLGLRYLLNALRGKPEPKFPRFAVNACAVIWNAPLHRVLTLRGGGELRTLPRLVCDGDSPLWEQLTAMILERTGLDVELNWVGIWQDALRNRLEFVFHAVVPNIDLFRAGEWSSPRNAALDDRDSKYVARVKAAPLPDAVWTMDHVDPSVQPGDTLNLPRR